MVSVGVFVRDLCICSNCRTVFVINRSQNEVVEDIKRSPWGRKHLTIQVNQAKELLNQALVKLLFTKAPSAKKVLDYGAGYGGLSGLLKSHSLDLTAADANSESVEELKIQGIKSICIHSVEDLHDYDFDAIFCVDVNYYWEDQNREFLAIYNRLNSKGIFILKSENRSLFLRLFLPIHHLLPYEMKRYFKRTLYDHQFAAPFSAVRRSLEANHFAIRYVNCEITRTTRSRMGLLLYLNDLAFRFLKIPPLFGYVVVAEKK